MEGGRLMLYGISFEEYCGEIDHGPTEKEIEEDREYRADCVCHAGGCEE